MTSESTDYGSLTELLDRSGSPLLLAELHGGLCGVICSGGRDAASGWLSDVLEDCTADAATVGELAGRLETLGNATWHALNGPALEFEPLLPDDGSAIEQRAEALALWCHGFLAGLVIGGLDLGEAGRALPEELTELVEDFAEISKAGADAGEMEQAEAGDRALTELVEYVRVGTQFFFEELSDQATPPEQRTLH